MVFRSPFCNTCFIAGTGIAAFFHAYIFCESEKRMACNEESAGGNSDL